MDRAGHHIKATASAGRADAAGQQRVPAHRLGRHPIRHRAERRPELVAEPGWWIGEADWSGQRRRREGDLEIVKGSACSFQVRVVSAETEHYIAFRGAPYPGEASQEDNSTLLEFG
ncbi:hypothetical protein Atai01_29680 [Amycolatopsis taiwanensis]|uniref:Uncharacterized protein n=1 Tax=Amycolatopsis taiwanensis TaxID=342230 RepID=A0A9W6QYI2_9PSEU|nr:hypothetical protein Atai01_29680 [Amycolatopsis taiwanensis]